MCSISIYKYLLFSFYRNTRIIMIYVHVSIATLLVWLTLDVEVYGVALHPGHVVGGEAGVGPLVLPLDVLHGEAVAWYDNAASLVLMYGVSLQRIATLFIIMVSVATARVQHRDTQTQPIFI